MTPLLLKFDFSFTVQEGCDEICDWDVELPHHSHVCKFKLSVLALSQGTTNEELRQSP